MLIVITLTSDLERAEKERAATSARALLSSL